VIRSLLAEDSTDVYFLLSFPRSFPLLNPFSPLIATRGLTLGGQHQGETVKACRLLFNQRPSGRFSDHTTFQAIIKTAFENGINFFDTAEEYASGVSETEM